MRFPSRWLAGAVAAGLVATGAFNDDIKAAANGHDPSVVAHHVALPGTQDVAIHDMSTDAAAIAVIDATAISAPVAEHVPLPGQDVAIHDMSTDAVTITAIFDAVVIPATVAGHEAFPGSQAVADHPTVINVAAIAVPDATSRTFPAAIYGTSLVPS